MALLLGTCAASAETRIALIIGNGDYVAANLKLSNPIRDAASMQRALQDAGFKTVVRLNAKRRDFYRAVDEFSAEIIRDPHSVGLFYYAGHGVQADGVNYLIPVDAEIESSSDLEANGFDVARVLRAMSAAQNEMNIVILDACRDNPLRNTRSVARGLARIEAPNGTFIAYAAAPGQTAQDGGHEGNGVFTGELIKAMREPDVPLEQMFKKVIAGVKAETRGAQTPWSEASVEGDFFFSTRAAPSVSGSDPYRMELEFWTSVKNSRSAVELQAYLSRYPHGEFAQLAANRLKQLQPADATTVVPPVTHSEAVSATVRARPQPPGGNQTSERSRRCRSIIEHVQLGDSLNDQDRTFIQEKCG